MSLENLIESHPKGLEPNLLHQLIIDMLFALSYAYKESVVHSDIKPANILIFMQNRENLSNINKSKEFSNYIFKLTDFGAGTLKSTNNETKLRSGMSFTPFYAAPEVILYNEEVDSEDNEVPTYNFEKADVYGLGLTILACCGITEKTIKLISKKKRINEEKHDECIKEILKNLDPKYQSKTEFLKGMLRFNKEKRDDLASLLKKLKIELPTFEISKSKRIAKSASNTHDCLPPNFIASETTYDFSENLPMLEEMASIINSTIDQYLQNNYQLANRAREIMNRLTSTSVLIANAKNLIDKKNLEEQKKENIYTLNYHKTKEGANEIYFGTLFEGDRQGFGLLKFSDGALYCGYFRRDAISDSGFKIFGKNEVNPKKLAFNGKWRNGLMEFGTLLFNPNDNSEDLIYIGQFESDKPEGQGIAIRGDGIIFDGLFLKGIKDQENSNVNISRPIVINDKTFANSLY